MKTILLLTHHLKDLAGSEINILELSKEFRNLGFRVEVGTFSYGYPIKKHFLDESIEVKNILHEKVNTSRYDLLWVQHAPLLAFILFEAEIEFGHIIFSSLSPYEPLEAPPLHLKEFISLFLANSNETKEKMVAEGLESSDVQLFPNSVPHNFFRSPKTLYAKELQRVAIVSNHLPKELYELKKLLQSRDKRVDIYGLGNRVELISPEILREYDAIITIGKTVQYALATAVPVFVYDKYGGDGWVNLEEIGGMQRCNFSGRYKKQKLTATEIEKLLESGYNSTLQQCDKLQEYARSRYSLSKNIETTLAELKKPIQIDRDRYLYMKRTSRIYSRTVEKLAGAKSIDSSNSTDKKELQIYNLELKLRNIHEHNLSLQEDLESAYNSFRWKIFAPLDRLRKKSLLKSIYLAVKSSRILRISYHKLPLSSQAKWKIRQFIATGKIASGAKVRISEDRLSCARIDTADTTNKPTLTVIIPCYNQGGYLWESVPSAYSSYSGDVEVIIVNDGSSESKTLKSLSEIIKFYPELIVIHKKNGGLSSARNRGLEHASGDYIQFLDADDTLAPSKVDIQLSQSESLDNILICNYLTANETYSEFYKKEETIKGVPLTLNAFLMEWERGLSVPIHCGLFPVTLFSTISFDEELSAKEDWLFWTTLLKSGYKLQYIDSHCVIYRVHTESMVRQSFVTMAQEWEKASAKIAALLSPNEKNLFLQESNRWLARYYKSNPLYNEELKEKVMLKKPSKKNTPTKVEYTTNRVERVVTRCHNFNSATPIISVVVPIFNHYNYLLECLESVTQQGDIAIELICIDDNSSDRRVVTLLRKLEGINPNIKIILQDENRGISYSQNRAVELAKGEYIALLDCDDYLKDGALLEVFGYIKKHPDVDYFFTDRTNIDSQGKILYDALYSSVRRSSIKYDLLDRMVASHLKVIKKSTYNSLGGCDELMSGIQDWELALKIAQNGTLHYIPQKLYFHRLHENSVTSSLAISQYKKTNILRRKYAQQWLQEKKLEENEYKKKIHQALTEGFNEVDTQIFTPKNLKIESWYSPEPLQKAFAESKIIIFDARGGIDSAYIDFLKDFNSYFDIILCDRLSLSAQLIGTLWSEKLITSRCVDRTERAKQK